MDGGAWKAAVHRVAEGRTQLSDFSFTFYFHALEKEMATHSSVLVWRIPRMREPSGLPSMGLHRVGHDWSDLAAADHGSNRESAKTVPRLSGLSISLILDLRAKVLFGGHIFRSSWKCIVCVLSVSNILILISNLIFLRLWILNTLLKY